MLLHYVFHASFCPTCVTSRYLYIYVIPWGDLDVLVETIYVAIMDRVECVTISPTRNWLFEIPRFNVAGRSRIHLEYVVHGESWRGGRADTQSSLSRMK